MAKIWGVEPCWAIKMGVHVDLMIKKLYEFVVLPAKKWDWTIEPVKSGFFGSISKVVDLRIKHLFMTSENGNWNHVKHIRLMGCKSLLYVALFGFPDLFQTFQVQSLCDDPVQKWKTRKGLGSTSGWCFHPSEKYDPQYMESHKIPWFQTTNQTWLFNHFSRLSLGLFQCSSNYN